ncbi:MAG: hypothetical protein ACD_20C00191G0004 [uncultured bacterium]|nr:MAG: hypothetical protein ACD_20C00191G0004 [uncultured bacterium]
MALARVFVKTLTEDIMKNKKQEELLYRLLDMKHCLEIAERYIKSAQEVFDEIQEFKHILKDIK